MTKANVEGRGSATGPWIRRSYAVLLSLVGLALSVGGVLLAADGGSLYYVVAGVAVLASGVFLWRGDRRGVRLYGAMLVGTVGWAVWEVGFQPWGLVPRLVAPFVLGLGLLLPSLSRTPRGAPVMRAVRGWPAFVGAIVVAVLVGAALNAAGPGVPADPLWRIGAQSQAPASVIRPAAAMGDGWAAFGNDQGGSRFSPVAEIDAGNVDRLQVAWEADAGPALPGPTGGLEVSPIMIDDSLYVCNGYNTVIAFDAENGRERWRYDMTGDVKRSGKPCRGVSYYRVPGVTGPCAERIFAASQTPDLVALDARTGRPCPGFGDGGRASLLAGLGEVPFGIYYVSSAPQVVRGVVVVGSGIIDGQAWEGPSGVIRAFDAVTGQLAWAFDVGHPDRHGPPPPGETYTRSTPNAWAPLSADEELGLVYLPLGGGTPDLFGGQRRPFDDAFGSSVIALDAATGTLRWRFQTTHHDIWDYDAPSQPTLVDLPTADGVRKALIQPTKRGEIFVLDRTTGQPIKSVEEIPVPQGGTAPGERLSPTQPFSTAMPAFSGPRLRETDMWGVTPIDQMVCRIKFKEARYEGTLTPHTLDRPTIVQPGYGGGVDWGSVSLDVDRGMMIVNWMRLPIRDTLITRAEADRRGFKPFDGQGPVPSGNAPMEKTPYAGIGDPFLGPLGTPCSAPPWGLISAVDLSSGKVVWSEPLGSAERSGPLGIPSHLPLTMGVPFSGGTLTTRGGLVFVAGTVDQDIRAFDVTDGRELWKAELPAGGQATPMTYRSPSGRQFVLIAAGGKPSLKTTHGAKIVAYALPR